MILIPRGSQWSTLQIDYIKNWRNDEIVQMSVPAYPRNTCTPEYWHMLSKLSTGVTVARGLEITNHNATITKMPSTIFYHSKKKTLTTKSSIDSFYTLFTSGLAAPNSFWMHDDEILIIPVHRNENQLWIFSGIYGGISTTWFWSQVEVNDPRSKSTTSKTILTMRSRSVMFMYIYGAQRCAVSSLFQEFIEVLRTEV
jgi:hypothetical protein